jgi:hypothetical protein
MQQSPTESCRRKSRSMVRMTFSAPTRRDRAAHSGANEGAGEGVARIDLGAVPFSFSRIPEPQPRLAKVFTLTALLLLMSSLLWADAPDCRKYPHAAECTATGNGLGTLALVILVVLAVVVVAVVALVFLVRRRARRRPPSPPPGY